MSFREVFFIRVYIHYRRCLVNKICCFLSDLLLSVTYPKRGNYSFIFLSCLHHRKPKKGAQFLKDNRFIHVGTRETDVTSYTPRNDGTALISFTQAQEGNFSCYKGQCRYCFSENVALAGSTSCIAFFGNGRTGQ